MKRNINFPGARIRISLLLAISMLFTLCTRPVKISQEIYDKIQEGFITPADTNKPWCYYYWIGDDISKEAIKGPENSITLSVAPLTDMFFIIARMTSFAVTPDLRSP